MIFLSFNDMNIGHLIPDDNHIKMEAKWKPGFSDQFKYIRPTLSTELKKWMEDNKIQYELRGITDWIVLPKGSSGMSKIYSQLGIEFMKPSEAVLFKLRWL